MVQFIYDKEDLEMWAKAVSDKARRNNLTCMYETHDYSRHGYFDVYFMTDKFGGTFACLRLKGSKVQFTDYKTPFVDIEKLSDSIEPIFKACIRMNKARDLDGVYAAINREYD